MCGIVGYVGAQQAAPILLEGLQKLEYRGYDSAGIAVLDGSTIELAKACGEIKNLLMIVGLGFKLSLVPFHLWTPDVYQGAPAPVSEQVWNYIPFLRRRDLILLWILFEKVWGYCRKRQSILDGCTDSPWSD